MAANQNPLRSRLSSALAALAAVLLFLVFSAPASAAVVTGRPHHSARGGSAPSEVGFSSDAISASSAAGPQVNRPASPATLDACGNAPDGSACIADALSDINSARAAEGVAAMELPSNFAALSPPQQLLVLANLERIPRGLAPVGGLSANLDSIAAAAAAQDADPFPSQFNGDALTANWAGGTGSTLLADFLWMYDDGPGSGNQDCTKAGDSGCWGHRHDILYQFDTPIAMGAAEVGGTAYGPSIAELFVGGDTATNPGQADAPIAPTWAQLSQSLMAVLSTSTVHLAAGVQSAQLSISSPSVAMSVGAAVTAGGKDWAVSGETCHLAAGASCQMTISLRAKGATVPGTLTLYEPAGQQTVTLYGPGSETFTARFSRRQIHRGTAVNVTGQLRAASPTQVRDQLVTLQARSARGGLRVVARRRTNGAGVVNFRVSPRTSTDYRLVYTGSAVLAPVSTCCHTVRVTGSGKRHCHGALKRRR